MTLVATHSGPFHADDVVALALIRSFWDPEAQVVRSRKSEDHERADIVIDVGSSYAPENRRFDHHQRSYEGALSSAGMVLNWLENEKKLSERLAQRLRDKLVDYIDAVDNGRRTPEADVPCLPAIVAQLSEAASSEEEWLEAYLGAAQLVQSLICGMDIGFNKEIAAEDAVMKSMAEAMDAGRSVLFLDQYYKWKPAYFALGGAEHPTEYVLFPGNDSWRIVAIPPELNSMDEKRSFPEEWAGLENEELSRVIGVEGARFCHKNRFIAVFETREAAIEALHKWGLFTCPDSFRKSA